MAKKFSEVREEVTPERRGRIDAKKREMLTEMRMYDLRRARDKTQADLAQSMEVAQSEVSKLERRTDAYISTIRSYIKAMGGELHIIAVFPDGEEVEITQFHELQEA